MNSTTPPFRIVAAGLCVIARLVAPASPAAAQASPATAQNSPSPVARNLFDLGFLLRPGNALIVTSTSSEELEGTFSGIVIDPDTLLIDVGDVSLELPAGGISSVDVLVADSLWNGALIGAASGAAAALLLTAVSHDGSGSREFFSFALFTVAGGAGIGAGVDSLHKERVPVYLSPDRGLSTSIAPRRGPPGPAASVSMTLTW